MNWWRIKTITTETGGKIDVTYSGPDCVAGTRVPDVHALQDNRLRCYPVKWTPLGNPGPVTDFFHRYVVTDVVEADQTGGAPRTRTHYDYLGDPAWHYNDDTGLVPVETDKTWSNWRGYGAVRTVKGDPGEQTQSETRYFRGMHGDHLPIGTRSVRLPAIAVGAVPAVDDEDVFAGMTRETITYNGPGGPEVSASVSEPWRSPPTASRTRNGITVHARHVQIGASHTRTALDKGRAPRTTTTRTVFDDTYGMVVSVEDRGDDALTDDETCTLTDYARSPDAWLVAAVSRVRVFAVDCARAGAGGLTDDDVTGDQRTSYDGKAYGVAPATGDVTRTEALKAYHDGNPTYVTTATSEYDPYGRVVKTTDARGLVTTTGYLPAAGGPVTASTRTTDGTWRTTTTTDPAWGLPTSTVDANGRRTELAYDGLGRLVSVWKPGPDHPVAQLPLRVPDPGHHSGRGDQPCAHPRRRVRHDLHALRQPAAGAADAGAGRRRWTARRGHRHVLRLGRAPGADHRCLPVDRPARDRPVRPDRGRAHPDGHRLRRRRPHHRVGVHGRRAAGREPGRDRTLADHHGLWRGPRRRHPTGRRYRRIDRRRRPRPDHRAAAVPRRRGPRR